MSDRRYLTPFIITYEEHEKYSQYIVLHHVLDCVFVIIGSINKGREVFTFFFTKLKL